MIRVSFLATLLALGSKYTVLDKLDVKCNSVIFGSI